MPPVTHPITLRNYLYYAIKPLVPLYGRRRVRRCLALRKRSRVSDCWPILPGSEVPPVGWPGWPGGKKFGVVLTQDVEGEAGVDRCRQLMELQIKLGFRSSFNFIPEGVYRVTQDLRDELTKRGFEVGVHDLYHDGKLYRNRHDFAAKAARINGYLKEWGAVGFRSGFMHHNLAWIHDLDIAYDASTFDTDPFEPQPDGVETIFPFWVPGPGRKGYFELPYTLTQDSTMFLVLGDQNTDVWRRKFDWIAAHGGMALILSHPDYMDFSDARWTGREYPVSLYKEFLEYVRNKYEGAFWHGTPRELVAFMTCNREQKAAPATPKIELFSKALPTAAGSVWIDLDNTPHVPLFAPIIEELSRRGYEVLVTARDAFQVCDLAEKKGLACLKIGRHHGKNRVLKLLGLFYRAAQLAPIALREKPVIGFSHGSRSQILICNLLGIPTVLMADYEYAKYPPLMRPTWEMAPDVIPDSVLSCDSARIRKYPGIKEDVYVPSFRPTVGLLPLLGLKGDDILAVVRPPATEAHYHNPESEGLFARFMDRACSTEGVRVVLLPRNRKQHEVLRKESPNWFVNERTIVPQQAVDGLDLIWHADVVVSGGGTMNREAAALGVPVYSIFRGKIGAVDHQLQKQGRLTLVETLQGTDQIPLVRRKRVALNGSMASPALETIVDHVVEIIEGIVPRRISAAKAHGGQIRPEVVDCDVRQP